MESLIAGTDGKAYDPAGRFSNERLAPTWLVSEQQAQMIAASFAGPAILVAVSALLFAIGYLARKSGYLTRKAALGLWVLISVVPLNIAIYWCLLKLL